MLAEIFKKPKPHPGPAIFGTVQLLPLPASPRWDGQWETLVTRAEQEATALATGGVDALVVQNFHDQPYTRERIDPAGAIALAMLCRRLRQFTELPVGIAVLRNDLETALAVAVNADLDFIRAPLLSGAMMTEDGVVNSRFNELLHYRNRLKCELPPLLADVGTRHLSPDQTSRTASDGDRIAHLVRIARSLPPQAGNPTLIVSDRDLDPVEIERLKQAVGREILVEVQARSQDADAYYSQADGLILDQTGIRKDTAPAPDTLPLIDMIRVEETINRLRQVVPVGEMDPDIFLKR